MYLTVGRVQDAHGIRGELYVSLREAEAAWLPQLKTLRLTRLGQTAVEMNLVKARAHKHGFIATVSELQDRTAAERWRGAEFSIPEELLVAKSGETPFLKEVLGFTVWRENREHGVVKGFNFNGVQDLLVLELTDGRGEVEVPFVADWVVELDTEGKRLIVNMPDEFLDPEFWKA